MQLDQLFQTASEAGYGLRLEMKPPIDELPQFTITLIDKYGNGYGRGVKLQKDQSLTSIADVLYDSLKTSISMIAKGPNAA